MNKYVRKFFRYMFQSQQTQSIVHMQPQHSPTLPEEGSDLRGAFFTSATNLAGIFLGNETFGFASLGGVRWNDVELSVVDWTQVKILGDERQARQRIWDNGAMKTATIRLEEYQAVVRANRKLAIALQEQGLNEEAARFAYRAQILQRKVFWMQ